MRRKYATIAGLLALSGLCILVLVNCQSTPEPTPFPTPTPTPDPLALARTWVDDNMDMITGELVELVLDRDLGFGALDVHVKDLIRADVTEQMAVGLNASFALDDSNWRVVHVTLTGKVEITTDPVDVLGGLVEIPAILGTIEVTQPYIATLTGDSDFVWARVEDGLEIDIDLDAAQ